MPGRDVPRAGLAARRARRAQAALRRAPRHGEADTPAADDGDVVLSDCEDTAYTSLRRHDPDQVRRSAPRWRPLSPCGLPCAPMLACQTASHDASRAPGRRPPLPRLRRAPARAWLAAALRGGVDLIQLRDKDARRRRARRGREGVPRRRRRARRAVHPQRPARPGGGVRRRRRARRPGRRLARRRRARSSAPDRIVGRSTHEPAQATRPTPTPTSTTRRSARCTRRRPSRAARPRARATSRTPRRTVEQAVVRDRRPRRAQRAAASRPGATRSWSCARSPRPRTPRPPRASSRELLGVEVGSAKP